MARNRRSQSGAVWIIPVFKAGLLCLLLGGSSVGYVLQKNKIFELGQQINKREAQLERLKRENKLRANHLASLQLPHKLAERVREQKLGLIPPPAGQVIWLPEPLSETTANPTTTPALMVMRNVPRPASP